MLQTSIRLATRASDSLVGHINRGSRELNTGFLNVHYTSGACVRMCARVGVRVVFYLLYTHFKMLLVSHTPTIQIMTSTYDLIET